MAPEGAASAPEAAHSELALLKGDLSIAGSRRLFSRYTHGVLGGRLSIEEMCMKLSTNPARIMGLAPREGSIAIGADADLAVIHPTRTHSVDPTTMETNADWSPFEGWELAGQAALVVRTEDLVDDPPYSGGVAHRVQALAADGFANLRVEQHGQT